MQFRYCVNSEVVNKSSDFHSLTTQFKDDIGTIQDVARHIKQGHSICASLLNGENRSKANVFGSQWLLLDVDNSDIATDQNGNPLDEYNRPITINGYPVDVNGDRIQQRDGRSAKKIYKKELTLDDALSNTFIKNHCALIYTTASHSPHWHRFRLVFLLEKFYQDRDLIESMIDLLMEQLPHDPSCKDASRIFYGNTQAEFPLINEGAILPQGWDILAASKANQAKERRAESEKKARERRDEFHQLVESEGWSIDKLVNDALFAIPPRSPGSQNYSECLKVLMALHSHYGADCEALAELWSPSIPGNTWNIPRKIRSFRRDGTTLGTLFAIAKKYGFKFPEAKKTENRAIAKRAATPVLDIYQEAEHSRKKDTYDDLIDEITEAKQTIVDLARRNFTFERIIKRYQISKKVFDQAVARVEALSDPSQKRSFNFAEFVKIHEETKSWVLPGVLERGELAIFAGKPKSGKSLHSYEAAYQVLAGGMFCGGHVKKGKVLFIQSDEGASSTINRIYGRRISEYPEQFRIMPKFSFARMEDLEQELIDFRPDLIIVDTLRQALRATGIDENSAEAGNPLSDFKELLGKYSASAILIHYTKKGEAKGQDKIAGNSALVGEVFAAFEFSKPDASKPSNFKMECLAYREDAESNYYHELMQNGDGWYLSYTGDEGSMEGEAGYSDRILELMKENLLKCGKSEFYAAEVATLLGVTPDRAKGVYMALKRLASKERVLRIKQPSTKGRAQYIYRLSETEKLWGGGDVLPNRQKDHISTKNNGNAVGNMPLNEPYNRGVTSVFDGNIECRNDQEIDGNTPVVTNCDTNLQPIYSNTSNSLVTQSLHPPQHPAEPPKDAHPMGKPGYINREYKKAHYDHKGTPYFVGSKVDWVDPLPAYQKMKTFVVERVMEDGVKLSMVREIIPHSQIQAVEDVAMGLRVGDRVTVNYQAIKNDGLPVKEMIEAAEQEIPERGTVCTITRMNKGKYLDIWFTNGERSYCQGPEYLIKE